MKIGLEELCADEPDDQPPPNRRQNRQKHWGRDRARLRKESGELYALLPRLLGLVWRQMLLLDLLLDVLFSHLVHLLLEGRLRKNQPRPDPSDDNEQNRWDQPVGDRSLRGLHLVKDLARRH